MLAVAACGYAVDSIESWHVHCLLIFTLWSITRRPCTFFIIFFLQMANEFRICWALNTAFLSDELSTRSTTSILVPWDPRRNHFPGAVESSTFFPHSLGLLFFLYMLWPLGPNKPKHSSWPNALGSVFSSINLFYSGEGVAWQGG